MNDTPCTNPSDLVEAAERRLHCSPWLPLHGVTCETNNGVLILTGHVPTYYLKQIATTLVGDVPGVNAIVNAVEVVNAPARVANAR